MCGSAECVCSQAGLALPSSRGAAWHTAGLLSNMCALCSWGSTLRVQGSMPYIDRAAKIRTLEKRRDWGNYSSSPVGRPTGDMVIAYLAEKYHKEKGEKSGHVGFLVGILSQVFKSS